MDILPWIFGFLTTISVIYFLVSLFFGGDLLGEVDLGIDLGIDLGDIGGGDDGTFGCTIIAAFAAGFGVVGWLGSLQDWNLLTTLLFAGVFGLVMGRVVASLLRFVMSQQSEGIGPQNLLGLQARILIDIPAGRTGEAIIDDVSVEKYAVRAVDDRPLSRGDRVTVVDVSDGVLVVQKNLSSASE